ncbi:dihydrofolate reductase [Rhizobium sp. G21]|uniref:dihydrofolate reductase n=1 Tax=Rhizobium sp. G21 TaxID=2758439 RepID=UPI0016000080|nr:dihydrofolate reductase [Rhizobium sp. G21]MBB1250715.1 dihydrofolate reductase [Rhizobium sp. G21]
MKISLVVAMAENGVIGRDNGLPWRQSSDLKRFKAMTTGKPVVMGRKCYASIGRPLPGRPNIVITRNRDFTADGVAVAHDYDAAIALAAGEAKRLGVEEICVIGGGEIYRIAIETADLLHVTHILAEIDGDTFFPAIDPEIWAAGEAEELPSGEKDDHPTRFATYRRRSASPT